jgi:hypothetical protein
MYGNFVRQSLSVLKYYIKSDTKKNELIKYGGSEEGKRDNNNGNERNMTQKNETKASRVRCVIKIAYMCMCSVKWLRDTKEWMGFSRRCQANKRK